MAKKFKSTVEFFDMKENTIEILKMAAFSAILWMACNYFFNYGLVNASITTSTVLFNTAPVWIYAISLSPIVPL